MRVLLLMRGAPGCGKSTFIDENSLRPYALSADEIRLQCQSAQQTADGFEQVSTNNEKLVWSILFNLLEIRMQNGEFTVIDATNSKAEEMNRYKKLADDYRYRLYIVDMTDLSIEGCKRRNASRVPVKRVPEDVIDKMYARFKTQNIPSGIKAIKPEELDTIWTKRFDFSQYEKVVHIGDIHGCYTALMEYFKNGINDNYFYIFLGDYIDRGLENAEVMKFLFDLQQRKNVLMLEGNHERWLWLYGNDQAGKSKEFELVTRRQLDSGSVDKKEYRQFYRRLGQCAWYTYDDKEIFVSHGGVAKIPENITKLATCQMIGGVGSYNDCDKIAETWNRLMPSTSYQIHGHRNTKGLPVRVQDNVFNLEGKVEFGGDLRIVELSHEGFNIVEIKNTVFKQVEESVPQTDAQVSVADAVIKMRSERKNIQEKNFGHISSFNFTREVFNNRKWNSRTVKARGLYVDVDKYKVAARSYDKFFKVNETELTRFENLERMLEFPVTAYVKENGFLGIVAHDDYSEFEDNLLLTTKSSITGDYAQWLRKILNSKTTPEIRQRMSEFCKKDDCSLVFECIDPENDPHIIEYAEPELVLLACVKNDLKFEQVSYSELTEIANDFGLKVKRTAAVLNTWPEFCKWYEEVTADDYKYDENYIEGFVIEGSNGFMTKIKLHYYNFWKHMRSVADKTLRIGYITQTSQLADALSNEFYGFLRSLYNSKETKEEREAIPRDIITLRRLFYGDNENNQN